MPGNQWNSAFFYFTSLVVLSPLMAIIFKSFSRSEVFEFLFLNVLGNLLFNTAVIVILTAIGVLAVGISSAWFVSQYSFWGRRLLQWALFMPLAFPAYILAYVYTDYFDEAGQLVQSLSTIGLDWIVPNLRTIGGASFILTFCLYPYVYLFARNGFLAGSKNQIESAALLGAGQWQQFFTIALPAARPFIIVGLMLVIMETLADYGVMDYFGIKVFSTVIYDSWAGYGDITAAARLSVLLLGFILLLVFFEKNQRGKMQFSGSDSAALAGEPQKKGNILMGCFCALPVLIGFVFPVIIMLQMVIETVDLNAIAQTLPYLKNTFFCAFLVAVCGVLIGFIFTAQARASSQASMNNMLALCGFGYALPGIILGLGFLLVSSFFSRIGLLITGTFLFLSVGYLIRFLNVALQSIDAGYDKIGASIDEASRMMRSNRFDDLWHVKLPLLWPSIVSAALILAVEVIKELPLTLVLRPFDFDTLAVYTYNLASDERLVEAAFPALCIVIAGCIPILFLHRFTAKN